MTAEQLQAVLAQARTKRTYLEGKAIPGQPIPKWLQMELNFVTDHEHLANGLYNALQREERHKKNISRLTSLITLFESAFNQIMKHRPGLVSWTGKVEAIQLRPLVFFHIARLFPDRLNKNIALQFYHEFTNELLTGRTTNPTSGTATINSYPESSGKPDS
jgi:hypothetical protein